MAFPSRGVNRRRETKVGRESAVQGCQVTTRHPRPSLTFTSTRRRVGARECGKIRNPFQAGHLPLLYSEILRQSLREMEPGEI